MKLFAYFARFYAGIIALMEGGLIIIVVGASFVEKAGYLARAESGSATALGLALYGAVQFGHMVFPVACFLGALVAGTLLARTGEILAVQAGGISTWRIVASFAAVVAAAVVLGGIMGEYVVPVAKARLDRLQRGDPTPPVEALGSFYDRHTQWFRQGNLLLYLPSFDADSGTFGDVVVYRRERGLVASGTDADELAFEDGGWVLEGAREHVVDGAEVVARERMALGLSVKPQDLIDVTGEPTVMRSGDILGYARRRERAGFDPAQFRIELYNRAAFPLSALCMFALAIPWALDPGRRRSLAVNLGAGVVAVGVLLSVMYIFRLLALSHRLSPAAGAWGLDLLCIALAPVSYALYQRYRTRGSLW